jgi:GT2 family glycosyltransferase
MDWKYYNPKFEYEGTFPDFGWPWAGHKNFAYDFIRNINSKRIVELGTHKGTSLFSFCQAVKDGKIDCELDAIDTWKGDEHASFYGEEILDEVKEIKEIFYKNLKINLIRKTFDEALADFQDKSIDLLHIDGLHTYEAVKHDFENWNSKVKDDGIILFHDIFVNQNDFGVYKLWEELKKKYKTIEFHHSFGLGVLFKDEKKYEYFIKNEKELQMIYSFYSESGKGEVINSYLDTIYQKSVKIQQKNETIQQKNETIQQKNETIQQKNTQIADLEENNLIKENALFEIRTSLRWKIPNFIYKIYKKKIKKFIPRFFFHLASPLFVYLDRAKHDQIDSNSRFKMELKKIEKLKFDSIADLVFKKTANPKASIVIPVYNKWRYTYSCLEELLGNINGTEYEVIIVDDCSTDETPKMMKKIENAIYVRNEKNLGFIGSCNAGAEKATGEYVVFLNNDTHILPNWLESLLETFEKNESIGLAGSKLVYPDGRLQEAGGVVWKNENVWNYGRFKDPENFEFNYLKDVDYCSAASIALPKKLFEKLGGFDSYYAPAYFEDTDLAFRVRQAGYRTVYQPKSEVIHFEGISNGKDLKKGVKKYQEMNKKKFFSRWKEVLEKENCADSEGPIFARDRSKGKKLMLFLDWNVPTFDKDAGSFVAFQYLKMLKSLGYKIIFWPHNLAKLEFYTETLQQMGIEVAYGNASFEKFIKEYGSQIDISLVSRPEVAKEYLDLIKQYSKGKIIYIAHDLHYLRMGREAEISNDLEVKKKAEEMKLLEMSIMRKCDISLFFSDKEVEIVKKEFPEINTDTMAWIQNMHAEKNFPGFADREGIIFIGGFNHRPNIDSVIWFRNEIFLRIKNKIPNIKITIIGSNATSEILALNDENFKIIGFVKEEDLPQFFDQNKIFTAPLRFGAGFKGKIAKAISFGIPVVTTNIGSEGIGLLDGETALIADNAEEFAEKIVKLYSDKELWGKISKNSMKHLQANFSTEAARKKFQAVLGELEK